MCKISSFSFDQHQIYCLLVFRSYMQGYWVFQSGKQEDSKQMSQKLPESTRIDFKTIMKWILFCNDWIYTNQKSSDMSLCLTGWCEALKDIGTFYSVLWREWKRWSLNPILNVFQYISGNRIACVSYLSVIIAGKLFHHDFIRIRLRASLYF